MSMTRLAAAAFLAVAVVVAPALAQEFTPFPDRYYYQGAPRQLEGKPLPTIAAKDWTTKPVTRADMKGKVVIIDFWATWCGPCRAALPKNVDLWNKHKDDGLLILGIHDAKRGSGTMRQVMSQAGVEYPNAVDDGGKSQQAFGLRFWPTYVAVDHKGIVRAVGLNPSFVPEVVETLLQEREADLAADADSGDRKSVQAAAGKASISPEWLEGHKGRRNQLAELEGREPPALAVTGWVNAEPSTLEDHRGKVVMLDFWATWCGPCLAAIPHTNELAETYADQGLVVIGVCQPRGSDKMGEVITSRNIAYPVCIDPDGKTIEAYNVDGFPDYYFIDRAGNLRVADAQNNRLEDVIKALLAEPAPKAAAAAASQ